MIERPILMRGPLVLASLEDRKTNTRRVIVPQRTDDTGWLYHDRGRRVYAVRAGMTGLAMQALLDVCPFGAVGDRLWVRETWAPHPDSNYGPIYRATDPGWDDNDYGIKWRPSIFMPRRASRLTLEITGVRVERVQDITPADKEAEGLNASHGYGPAAFESLWDEINAKRGYGWAVNPWVWCISYRRVTTE